MKSYFGSWFGYAAAPPLKPEIKPIGTGHEIVQNDEFYDAIEYETEQIQRASEQIFELTAEELQRGTVMLENHEGDPIANFNATFNMKQFKLSLIDDSKVVAISETGDPFQDFELSEIIVVIKELCLSFDHFDEDEIRNQNSSHIKASLGDLGLIYVEKFEQKSFSKLLTQEHKILWKQDSEHPLTDVNYIIANQKIKALKKDK